MANNTNNDGNFQEQINVYSRIYKRLNNIISIEQFLQSKELSFKSNGFVGLMIEKDIENPFEIYLLNYIESTGELILDLEIKVKLYPEDKKAEVLYINDGFSTKSVYSKNKTNYKLQKSLNNFFIKWLWILQDGRK